MLNGGLLSVAEVAVDDGHGQPTRTYVTRRRQRCALAFRCDHHDYSVIHASGQNKWPWEFDADAAWCSEASGTWGGCFRLKTEEHRTRYRPS